MAAPETNTTSRMENKHPMGTTTQHPRLLPLPQRIIRYPPKAKRPRLSRMVKPTLSKMLSTIQNRQPLPNG
jgi:hypothetical protein